MYMTSCAKKVGGGSLGVYLVQRTTSLMLRYLSICWAWNVGAASRTRFHWRRHDNAAYFSCGTGTKRRQYWWCAIGNQRWRNAGCRCTNVFNFPSEELGKLFCGMAGNAGSITIATSKVDNERHSWNDDPWLDCTRSSQCCYLLNTLYTRQVLVQRLTIPLHCNAFGSQKIYCIVAMLY